MLVVNILHHRGTGGNRKEAVQRTFDFIRSSRPHAVQVNVLDCLIGTSIWEDLEKNNLVGKDDWKRNHRIYEYNKDGLR